MTNLGVAPPNPATEIGQLRYIIGDTVFVPLNPPVPGFGEYEAFSDAELQALLDLGGSFPNAVGYAYLKLAGLAAGSTVEWSSDDLRVNLSRTAGELRAIAEMWFERGSSAAGNVDFVFSSTVGGACGCVPELAPHPWPFGGWDCPTHAPVPPSGGGGLDGGTP